VAWAGSTCWLADRCDDVQAVVAGIEQREGQVGRVAPLEGETDGQPNCLHPEIIGLWQAKGYNYRAGYCGVRCERRDNLHDCPFLASLTALNDADTIVATKALARRPGFFSGTGNEHRRTVVLDEDPIGLLRPLVILTHADLQEYLRTLDRIDLSLQQMRDPGKAAAILAQSRASRRIAEWCSRQMERQSADGQFQAVEVPADLQPTRPVLGQTKRKQKQSRRALEARFHRLMRHDPARTIRNILRDLFDLVSRATGKTVFVTVARLLFHRRVNVPRQKQVIVLDATANAELLRSVFAPRPVEVLCDERVQPAGRVIQFMDFNGPRSYLNKIPAKLVRILDALGDLHPEGTIVLISHRSCVEALAKASKHAQRMRTAHFGALRGRNDLEPGPGNRIACHIVAGSPKTTEEDRRQIALAVYGRSVLPFRDLETVRRGVVGLVPQELADEDGQRQVWEVRLKGYTDPRMQAIYNHTVTAELTHAVDRARVLIHQDATVYLVTNEPCPRLWFAEMCFANDLLDLSADCPDGRADRFQAAYAKYAEKARQLLDARPSTGTGNADVCRALERRAGWGKRYWQKFIRQYGDSLEGARKKRWKAE
jgi:hypothetical protein